jgi:hypothetical protein
MLWARAREARAGEKKAGGRWPAAASEASLVTIVGTKTHAKRRYAGWSSLASTRRAACYR